MAEEKEVLTMKRSEIKRLQVIEKTINQEIKQVAAAEMLGITDRQVRRLVKRVRREGAKGIIHGLRGKESNRRLDGKIRDQIIAVYKKSYAGFGPTLASEKLQEREGIKISKESLRQWLMAEGMWDRPKATKGRHLRWRERKAHYGEMVQVDGSHHAWLEERGPRLVLMGWIDDATNRTDGRFYEYEGTMPALDGLKRYIKKHGIPGSIYVDRHTTYKSWAKESIEEELQQERAKSHFEKACDKLGVRVIHAYSPQAKGRVERLFKTLQDRLVKELRLAGAKTQEESNDVLERFLVAYNAKFGVPAREPGDMHRAWPQELKSEEIFAVYTERRLRNDNTLVYEGQWYQVCSRVRAEKVMVREGLDGRIVIMGKGEKLRYQTIPGPIPRPKKIPTRVPRRPTIPAADHPWRQYASQS
jgi:transposase